MRLVQLRVPVESREPVLEVLDEEGVDHVDTPETDGDATLVHFPLPTEAVESVLDAVHEVGLEDDGYAVVASAETARSPRFQELEEQYVAGSGAEDALTDAELRSKTLNLTPSRLVYYAMTLLSVLVAVAGLLLDAPSVVVGAMVVAPQVGASLTTAVGATLDDRLMFWNGLRLQFYSLLGSVLAAALFGWAIRNAGFVPPMLDISTVSQISSRTSPGLLTLLVGLCAGAAGGFSLASDIPESLVGVAVAVALVPAAAAAGIGIAWGYPSVTVGASLLLVVNAISINVAAVAVLWGLGYRPWEEVDGPLADLARAARFRRVLVAAAVTAILLLAPGALIANQVVFENDANDAIEETLERPEYDELELVSTHVGFGSGTPDSSSISVTIARPADGAYPQLADAISRAVEVRTGETSLVEIEFVERTRSG
ncbi:TIGR00341 family protein [Halorarum halophilum]|uniref:TIGR00341 family protein n=1 Tax=Halorarum halophilum TaxID=2743090 RepID=A0A7D5K6Z2_9EURY|nr:TIGR00341 family protein [Halobaculum halophilum]QLG27014.1 TIGR00341 family protein [Halobaculum halophilum]